MSRGLFGKGEFSFYFFVLSRCGFSFLFGENFLVILYLVYVCIIIRPKMKTTSTKNRRKTDIRARSQTHLVFFPWMMMLLRCFPIVFPFIFSIICIFPHCERNGAVHHAICVSLVLPKVPSYTVQPQWVLCYFRKIENVQNSDGKSLAWNATLSDDNGHPQPPSCSFVSLLVRWLVNSNVKWKFHNRKRQKQENFEIPNPPADR